MRRYTDEIQRMNGEFQLVLDTVCKRAGLDNALIAFAGDKGFPFPHGKGTLYDPGLSVPFLVSWQGKIKPVSICDDLISGEDYPPTMLAAAGIAAAKDMSGVGFPVRLLGRPHQPPRHVFAQRLTHGSRPSAHHRDGAGAPDCDFKPKRTQERRLEQERVSESHPTLF